MKRTYYSYAVLKKRYFKFMKKQYFIENFICKYEIYTNDNANYKVDFLVVNRKSDEVIKKLTATINIEETTNSIFDAQTLGMSDVFNWDTIIEEAKKTLFEFFASNKIDDFILLRTETDIEFFI